MKRTWKRDGTNLCRGIIDMILKWMKTRSCLEVRKCINQSPKADGLLWKMASSHVKYARFVVSGLNQAKTPSLMVPKECWCETAVMLKLFEDIDLKRVSRSVFFYYIYTDAYWPCTLCEWFAKEEQRMRIRTISLVKAQGVNVFQSDTRESQSQPVGFPLVARAEQWLS